MIVGVGGQGTLLASRIIGNVALTAGYDVKVSEVHGMAQRGGSVVTYVRFSKDEKVASPVICKGEADYLISFEQLESARWLEYVRDGGLLISSTQKVLPMPVITGAAEYPDGILDTVKELGVKCVACDAPAIAEQLGNIKASNVVLIGLFAKCCEGILDFTKEEFVEAVKACVPAKFAELNLAAFEAGYEADSGK